MASTEPPALSHDAEAVLSLLRDSHNALISGPPATGKTRLLSEIRRAFEWSPGPAYVPERRIPLPADAVTQALWLPSPARADRQVFNTVFDQSTKMRDVLRGVLPVVGAGNADTKSVQFMVSRGTLYRAAEHALTDDGAALMIVDEINRGPAVAAFGPSLVALESDKRLDTDGKPTQETQTFELLDDNGNVVDYALPAHLYVLGAMNQADTSVEAMDVAFLRRFAPFKLKPSGQTLRSHFSLGSGASPLPAAPASASDYYEAAVTAWEMVNQRLTLGRGDAYQIGHGTLMNGAPPTGLSESADYLRIGWSSVRQHVEEVFFGDTRGIAAVLSANAAGSPYKLTESTFAGQPVVQFDAPDDLSDAELYGVLRSISTT
ncbi:hypothetical protein GCM10027169_17090 [Gordonia jinhuaensis]|uniref:AAA domain (Dynein-related subfamily) n=1 Tax=Gordonia jinhuaensis TaxID=1517702 RepID=A0A916TJS5_9ACTN|nr:AAA family ATPase [Gordonia jinhuaensis]GGB47663.1 hypothetical protein GCM10011489_38620 [Gordonia jinhuaensis]